MCSVICFKCRFILSTKQMNQNQTSHFWILQDSFVLRSLFCLIENEFPSNVSNNNKYSWFYTVTTKWACENCPKGEKKISLKTNVTCSDWNYNKRQTLEILQIAINNIWGGTGLVLEILHALKTTRKDFQWGAVEGDRSLIHTKLFWNTSVGNMDKYGGICITRWIQH